MSTNVYESTVCCAPIEAVWQLVRNCDFRFLNAVSEARLESGDSWCEVGSVRVITYADKNKSRRWYSLDELSDTNHTLTYSMIRAEPDVPVQAAVHTIRLRRITKPASQCFMQFCSEFSRDVTDAVLDESRAHKMAFFAGVNRALRQDISKDEREKEHHTSLSRLLEAKFGALQRPAECRGPQAQRLIATSAAPTFASPGQVAGKQEPEPKRLSTGPPADSKAPFKGVAAAPQAIPFGVKAAQRGVNAQECRECCGCSEPCTCSCCSRKSGEEQAQFRPESRAAAGKTAVPPAGKSSAAQSQASKPSELVIGALQQRQNEPARVASESAAQGGVPRAVSQTRRSQSPEVGAAGECHPPSFAKASEVLEHADFNALKSLTAQTVDELWQSLPKEAHGALKVEDAESFVDCLMDRMAEEDNQMVHFVARMLQEPGSPPSFAVDENFTPQLRQSLKKWKRGAAKQLVGKLDRNRDGLIAKEEFSVLFSSWFGKQLYEELRASFFG